MLSSIFLFLEGLVLSRAAGRLWDFAWDGYDSIFTLINVVSLYIVTIGFKSNIRAIYRISTDTIAIFFIHRIIIQATLLYIERVVILHTFIGNCIYSLCIIAGCILVACVLHKIPLFKELL